MNPRPQPSIVWFRRDLRLTDNSALTAAVKRGAPVIPVYIGSLDDEGDWPPGAASRWWLHQSLLDLSAGLKRVGSRLIVRRGPSLGELRGLIHETRADAVYWNRRYEPAAAERDLQIETELRADGLRVETFGGALLFEPDAVRNRSGRPFQVFSPFWRTCLELAEPGATRSAPRWIPAPQPSCPSLPLAALHLEPPVDWADGMRRAWQPGERGALKQMDCFLDKAFGMYAERRDRPDLVATSRLSPHLHFGEIAPSRIWGAIRERQTRDVARGVGQSAETFLRELGWREFAHHLLHHFPRTANEPLQSKFKDFPWRRRAAWLKAWRKGRTGYPIVDAGMRELWSTGWMHNRVRMIVASFLVKDLLMDWRMGAAWFWDTLVDADLANNTLGWQWVAGCGADAAPYFRIFNPVSQGRKFDPEGAYVRKWVPELGRLPTGHIHAPWEAPASARRDAGIALGVQYPLPIVDHAVARQRALEALAMI